MLEDMKIKEVRIAYVSGVVPDNIREEMTEMSATMYNDDGGGQYVLENLRDRFDEEDEEYKALVKLIGDGYDFIEYS